MHKQSIHIQQETKNAQGKCEDSTWARWRQVDWGRACKATRVRMGFWPSGVWRDSAEVCLSDPGQWRSFQNTWQITGQRWRGLWERTLQKSAITSIPAREPPSLRSRKPRKGKRNSQMHQKVQVEREMSASQMHVFDLVYLLSNKTFHKLYHVCTWRVLWDPPPPYLDKCESKDETSVTV